MRTQPTIAQFEPMLADDLVDILEGFMAFYGLNHWTTARYADRVYTVSISVDARFDHRIAQHYGQLPSGREVWQISGEGETLAAAIGAATTRLIDAAPSFEMQHAPAAPVRPVAAQAVAL
ncbi:hypothetical protein [Rhodococcus ruber]|uniref:hypothetical protein n=1 Tax=Rhodococcus ruber TaxID=1830 RepID=UPI0037835A06